MSERDRILKLIERASHSAQIHVWQAIAARKLLSYDRGIFPSDGCAITLSVMLQDVGIPVEDTFKAIDLGRLLKNGRKWDVVENGKQQAGDVGTTCGTTPHHGFDHIYFVLRVINADEMVVADNQAPHPHFRYISGIGGKTPTTFFLRAPSEV